jgi:hypothetical protein
MRQQLTATPSRVLPSVMGAWGSLDDLVARASTRGEFSGAEVDALLGA